MVGPWNAAIITPHWLKTQFPDLVTGTNFELVYTPSPMPGFTFVVDNVLVDALGGHLRLTPHTDDESRLQFIPTLAKAIYSKLPHTPVQAIGYNFVYQLGEDESAAAFEYVRSEEQSRFYEETGIGAVTTARIAHTFARPTGQLNLRFERGDGPAILALNFHYNVNQPQQVREAIDSFDENYTTAQALSKKLIKHKS